MVASDNVLLDSHRYFSPMMAVESESKTTTSTSGVSIDWNNWRIFGRETEIQQLEECYLTRKDCGLVLITGPLGIGKSALTGCLQRRVSEDTGLLIRGCFTSFQTEPYGAFVEAITDLVRQIQLHKDFEALRSDLRQAIAASGAEWFLISDVLSVLGAIVQDSDNSRHSDIDNSTRSTSSHWNQLQTGDQQQTISASDRQYRFVKAATKVVEAIGSVFPLVMVLDNLMWADAGSILLLESFCLTGKLSNVLLVATCREDEVKFEDPVSVKLRSIEDGGARLIDINLPPLSVDSVCVLTSALTSSCIDEVSVRQLAASVHACTGGVPLLLCELFGVLEREGPDSELLNKRLSYNEFINDKVNHIPSSRQTLQLIACLGGGSVHEAVLAELLSETPTDTKANLLAAQEQGLITLYHDEKECAFAHANIQATVYNMITPTERSFIHYTIAKRLCSWLPQEQIEENVFLVIEQYLQANKLIPLEEKEEVAHLCLIAARKAASSAAFSSAEDYVRLGLSLMMPRTKWRDSYDLTLALMNATIELEYCHGNHERVDELHEEIRHYSRTPTDAVTSYSTYITSLGSRGKTNEAIAEGVNVLNNLGENIPRRTVGLRLLFRLFKMKRIMKRTSDDHILSLPLLCDEKAAAVCKIMNIMFLYIFMKQSDLVPIISMRMMELTLQYGLYPMSANSFAIFGLVEMNALQNFEEGYRCAELSLKLMEAIKCPELTARTYAAVFGFLKAFKEPLRDGLKPLEDAYRLNILTGDVELAITCKSLCLGNSLQSGAPLFQVLSGFRDLIEICNVHNQRWNEQVVRLSAQFALNLSGLNSVNKPFELSGEFMTEKTVEADILAEKNGVQLAWLYFLKYMMAVYLCDDPVSLEAEPLVQPLKKYLNMAGFYTCRQQSFHEGLLSCFLASSATGRRRRSLLARAERRLETMKKFASTCPANFQNKAALLEAEIESVKGIKPTMDIVPLYEAAAALASKEGFLQEQALALEKAGRYLLTLKQRSKNDFEVSHARALFVRAIDTYEIYGAMLKVDQLQKLLAIQLAETTL